MKKQAFGQKNHQKRHDFRKIGREGGISEKKVQNHAHQIQSQGHQVVYEVTGLDLKGMRLHSE